MVGNLYPTVTALRVVAALAQGGTVSAAAPLLNLTQSAVSKHEVGPWISGATANCPRGGSAQHSEALSQPDSTMIGVHRWRQSLPSPGHGPISIGPLSMAAAPTRADQSGERRRCALDVGPLPFGGHRLAAREQGVAAKGDDDEH